jgi:DHA1 family tetracycline resistance protein-like MFS transporter
LLQGGIAGRAARMLGERTTLLIGLALFSAGLGGLSVAHEVSTMSASLSAFVIGIGLATPALNALIAEQAAEHERGAVMGLSQSASALGRVAGPLGAGALFDAFGTGTPFLAGALVGLVALFVTHEGREAALLPDRIAGAVRTE